MIAIIIGSTTSAYYGIGLSTKISDALFKKVLLILLMIMGLLLISESFITFGYTGITFSSMYIQFIVAVLCGILIGIVSSLLGVAGGEVIIPILILIFGIDVKLAGTMSLIISIPTMIVGITRHTRNKMYKQIRNQFPCSSNGYSIYNCSFDRCILSYICSFTIIKNYIRCIIDIHFNQTTYRKRIKLFSPLDFFL